MNHLSGSRVALMRSAGFVFVAELRTEKLSNPGYLQKKMSYFIKSNTKFSFL